MTRSDWAFWAALGLVVVAIVAAGMWSAWRSVPTPPPAYLPDETRPEAVVYNAYVAAQRNDIERFRGYFQPWPWAGPGTVERIDTAFLESGELRVGPAHITDGEATVEVYLITSSGGFFGGPEVRVHRGKVRLVQEGERWRIASELPFVYPVRVEVPVPPAPGGD